MKRFAERILLTNKFAYLTKTFSGPFKIVTAAFVYKPFDTDLAAMLYDFNICVSNWHIFSNNTIIYQLLVSAII